MIPSTYRLLVARNHREAKKAFNVIRENYKGFEGFKFYVTELKYTTGSDVYYFKGSEIPKHYFRGMMFDEIILLDGVTRIKFI